MIREFVLQLKLGSIRPSYFAAKYGEDVAVALSRTARRAGGGRICSRTGPDRVTLTREGLLRVDSLLPRFFKPEHATVRYT